MTQIHNMEFHNADCMEIMAAYPDKHFDLAIVDVPYGVGEDGKSNHSRGRLVAATVYHPKNWDEPPFQEYFVELFRVSKNQIVWGANHFITKMAKDSPCWIVWDKVNGGSDQADCELAWTSFKTAVRMYQFMWAGMRQGDPSDGRFMQGNKALNEKRIHPTQKPVSLYSWLLAQYAEPGMKILDTHLGSGSIAIACYNHKMSLVGCELDADYFQAAMERIKRETNQVLLALA